jgi:hypothetical protein
LLTGTIQWPGRGGPWRCRAERRWRRGGPNCRPGSIRTRPIRFARGHRLRHRDAAGGRPLLAVLAVWARRRSLRAFLGLLGCLAFTAYNYVIYAFSIHFGPLSWSGSPFSACRCPPSSARWPAVLLRRQHPLGYATAARQLVWLALTCLPILVTPLVATTRGHPGLGRDAPTSANGTHPADPCEQVHVVSRTRLCGR